LREGADVANQMPEITGKSIEYVSPTREEFVETLLKAGINMPTEYLYILLALAQGEGDFISDDLANLLNKRPATLKQFLKQTYGS
jgi:NAD(P)H dehydrogenase (quinone)